MIAGVHLMDLLTVVLVQVKVSHFNSHATPSLGLLVFMLPPGQTGKRRHYAFSL